VHQIMEELIGFDPSLACKGRLSVLRKEVTPGTPSGLFNALN